MNRVLFKFLFFVFSCASIFGEPLALAELIDIALKNNPETQKAWSSVKRSQAQLGIVKSSQYPTLDASGSLSHDRQVKFPNGPNTVSTDYGGELTLTYLLYDCGERSAAIQATKEALKAAGWSSDFAIQQVIYKVAASYYEYVNAADLLKMKESSLQDAEKVLEAAKEVHKAGLRGSTDLSMSKAEVAQAQIELARQKAAAATAYGKLLTALGLSVEEKIAVDMEPAALQNPLFGLELPKLIALAEEQRADLLAKKASFAESEERVKEAGRSGLPKLRGQGQVGWLEYAKHQGSGYNYSGGIALEVPLFKGFEYTYRKRLAAADSDITAAELRDLHDAIALEVLSYSEAAKAAAAALHWSGAYFTEAMKSYEGSLESYKAGLQSIFDLIQAQAALSSARVKKVEAETQWLVSLAQLAFATGSTIR